MSGISEISAMREKYRSSGFTLIELMIVITLIAIVATFAVPSFSRLIDSNRLTAATNDLVGVINFARMEAIRHGRTVSVAPRTVGGVAGFQNGVEVALGATQLRVTDSVEPGISISNVGGFSFRGNGLANTTVTLKVCGQATDGREVRVSLGGQIRVVSDGIVCP